MRLRLNNRTVTGIAFLLLLVVFLLVNRQTSPQDAVLGVEDEVQISAYIRATGMSFKAYPEKRIPRIGNWDTFADLTLVNCVNPAKTYQFNNIPTDTTGFGSVVFSDDVFTFDGPYRIFVRGYSHLNRRFNCYPIEEALTHIDLTLEGKELLAGETSVVYDNYINALDMSVLIRELFTSSYKSDLNQDTEVNSLDFANQIYNLFISGD